MGTLYAAKYSTSTIPITQNRFPRVFQDSHPSNLPTNSSIFFLFNITGHSFSLSTPLAASWLWQSNFVWDTASTSPVTSDFPFVRCPGHLTCLYHRALMARYFLNFLSQLMELYPSNFCLTRWLASSLFYASPAQLCSTAATDTLILLSSTLTYSTRGVRSCDPLATIPVQVSSVRFPFRCFTPISQPHIQYVQNCTLYFHLPPTQRRRNYTKSCPSSCMFSFPEPST